MSNKNISVLIVDDNPCFVRRMSMLLDELDNVRIVNSAGSYDEAFKELDRNKHDMILLDINLPGKSGINVLRKIKAMDCSCEVIMLSNCTGKYYREQCKKLGALHFLDKTGEFDLVPSIVAAIAVNSPYVLC
jgi:DNA-binding NarL/FixJ family response regulator